MKGNHLRTSGPEDEGRVERFRVLYLTNYVPILGYALRRTQTEDDATDVVAETFLVLWRRLDEAPTGAETKPWLYGIARRVISNGRRSERRRARLVTRLEDLHNLDDAPSSGPTSVVSEAMEQLSARDRELLRLFAWEDLTPGEIATALGCSSNAAKVGLHRARKRLARRLDRLGVDVAFAVGSEPAFDPTIHATKEELR